MQSSFNGYMKAVANIKPLDEAYHGKSKIAGIQKAMDVIVAKLKKDTNWKVQGSKEAKNLEKEVVKAFGFARCSIYWTYQDISMNFSYTIPGMEFKDPNTGDTIGTPPISRQPNIGPYTIPSAVYVPVAQEKMRRVKGTDDNYDKLHTMACFITMDQNLLTNDNPLTSEENVAIMLHEIGHNFDATIFKTLSTWMPWLDLLIQFVKICNTYHATPQQVWDALGGQFKSLAAHYVKGELLSKFLPEIYGVMNNMEDIVLSHLGPLSRQLKPIISIGSKAYNTVIGVLAPVMSTLNLPAHIINMPISYISSTLGRKSETYADSFAAQYGYGPELGSALGKLDRVISAGGYGTENPILKPFYDLTLVYQGFFSMVDSHENVPERYQRAIRTLKYDLKDSELSAQDKKIILDEIKRIEKSYDQYIKLSTDDKHFIFATYTKAVDAWIKSDAYEFTQKFRLLPSQTYAH